MLDPEIVEALNALYEQMDETYERMNRNIFEYTATTAALIEVLDLPHDQKLVFLNRVNELYQAYCKEAGISPKRG
jgi:hypothetical protein